MDNALRALNRFGLGARIGERGRLGDPRAWLRAQLDGGPPVMSAADLPSPAEIGGALRSLRMAAADDRERRAEARRRLAEIMRRESRAALQARITSARPFVERLVAFWSNHLCVSAATKVLVAPLAGSYEREAIRPHVLGRFEDMVLASAQHPAMLTYLDNFQSIGPDSPAARRGGRRDVQRGLNENYARELLELHTLGVDGGYTQQDVQQLARILTGWTVDGLGGRYAGMMQRRQGRTQVQSAQDGPLRFAFIDLLHEPGTKTLLGVTYRENGVQEGERAIRALCRHPSTASFVATKLVRHFVADDPPAAAVERIASVFRSSDGDLRAVAGALIDLPEAWQTQHRKFRSPQDWLVALLRAVGNDGTQDAIALGLRQLRHPLWAPPSPAGFSDSMSDWADPDSLLNRAELARTIGRRIGPRPSVAHALLDVIDSAPGDPLPTLLADTSVPDDERAALVVAGPAFQWR